MAYLWAMTDSRCDAKITTFTVSSTPTLRQSIAMAKATYQCLFRHEVN